LPVSLIGMNAKLMTQVTGAAIRTVAGPTHPVLTPVGCPYPP
jgi:hypothetical protein